ncbi:hypothetical protein [Rhizobium hidalgonense]|uniref:hypothetical protein n=1 Tax=Rhizobium hidalgonense TaxID=1538159 RepID=UPI0013E3D661|nr:hypothetical protein [Rhizobium hidalgonense]
MLPTNAAVAIKKNPTSGSRNSPASGFRNSSRFGRCRRGETSNDFKTATNFGIPKCYTDYGGVWLADEFSEALDRFAEQEVDAPTHPEAVRRILRGWLSAHGFLPK